LDLIQESLSVTTIFLLQDLQHLKINFGEWEVHEDGPPLVLTLCNKCDTSIEYIQQHYFHYDAKRATGALATGRMGLKAAKEEN
jgi:hypothetical protein